MDVLSKDPATPSSLNISLSRDLETICMRCLDKDPKRRYASAKDLADDLDRFLDGTPILARRIGRIEKCLRWCRRKPAVAATVFLSILSLVIVPSAYLTYRSETIRHIMPRTEMPTARGLPLVHLARQQYAVNQPSIETDRDRAMVLAGQAMLAYDDDAPVWTNDTFADSEPLFRRASVELEQLLEDQPDDIAYRSALADCLMQLAEFRIAKSRLVTRKTGDGDAEYRRQRGVVAKEDEQEVARCLHRSVELLTGLLKEYPESMDLPARAATARMAMRSLPGDTWPNSFEERMRQVADAGSLSRTLDSAKGVVRFDFESAGAITVLEGDTDGKLRVTAWLDAASALFDAKRNADALDAYREAFAVSESVEEAPLNRIQSAFHDLALLSKERPDAVRFILERKWPESADAFYHAILGIRSAVAE